MTRKQELEEKRKEYLQQIKDLTDERDKINYRIGYKRKRLKDVNEELDNINNLKLPI